ncbi:MAG: hypothetical protein MZW92_04670 [Comamonadaceae bacterium]|nr:hypothetical protein [Comamonadaceae bacterium]
MALGGGRRRAGDAVDPRVGLGRRAGARRRGAAPASRWRGVHARDAADAENAVAAVQAAIGIADGGAARPRPGCTNALDA